jgi:PST family polysaccharide transporter/lipopolysaccharide exporter
VSPTGPGRPIRRGRRRSRFPSPYSYPVDDYEVPVSLSGPRALLARTIPDGDLTERAVKSGAWASAITAIDRALQVVKLVVVAALLGPAALGLMGIALLALAVLEVFSNLGLDVALVQRREENVDAYLDTAWAMQLARGALLAAAAWLGAPHAAAFFGEPESAALVRAIGLSPLLLGLRNPAVLYFQKNLEFHRQFGYQLSGTLLDVAVALALALATGSVWALVLGKLAGDAARTVASYVVHGYRPSLGFDLAQGRELFGYGKWIMGAGITAFLLGQGDDVFVGWFLGATALGFYQLGYRLASAPAAEVTKVISATMLPTYAKLQDDRAAVREAYFRVLQFTSFLTFPMSVGILVTAPAFVAGVLGPEWLPMVPVLQALTLWGLLLSVGANVGPLFRALGRPDLETKVQAAKLVLVALLVYPATDAYGLVGTAGAVVAASLLVSEPLANYLGLRLVGGTGRRFVRTLAYPAATSLAMGAVVYAVRESVALAPAVEFVVLVVVGVAAYAAAVLVVESTTDYDLASVLSLIRRNIA